MKKVFLIIILFFISISAYIHADNLLLEFNSKSFNGWIYNKPDIQLSSQIINGNKVLLYNDIINGKYTLVSPSISLADITEIKVEFEWICDNYDQKEYNTLKSAPTIELIGEDGKIASSYTYQLIEKSFVTEVSATIDTKDISSAKIMISAPNADLYNAGYIKAINIYNTSAGGINKTSTDNAIVYSIGNRIIAKNCHNADIQIIDLHTGIIISHTKSANGTYISRSLYAGVFAIRINNNIYKIIIS